MKTGAVIIHSSKYTKRKVYVDGLINFFKDTEVEVNIIEGVFTDDVYYDARQFLNDKKLSKGVIGCALAHRNAYKLALEKNYDYVYIFEDDVRVAVPSYLDLKTWINNISVSYDVLLMTNVGGYIGTGHDGRVHYKIKVSDDLYQGSCLFGVMSYFMNKDTLKLLYENQQKEIDRQRIFIGDGLPIHCEKEPGVFLNTVTPIETNKFFVHEGYESITVDVDNNSKISTKPKLSLCIPTVNRWDFLKVNIPKYLDNHYIEEIVICDENGNDAKLIKETYKDNKKIKVYVNDQILGAFFNKRKVVSLAKNDFVCLMDSDNFAPLSYFEAWYRYVQENGLNEKVVYCPARTIPHSNHQGFDYRSFIGSYTFEESKRNFSNITFNCMLNTGNYIFSKKLYMDSEPDESQKELASSCKALDVLFQNYLLFTKGNSVISVIPNMEYDHIVHDGSYYMETHKEINTNKFYTLFK